MPRFFFLRPAFINAVVMLSSAGVAVWSFVEIVSYWLHGDAIGPLVGPTRISFSASVMFYVLALCIFGCRVRDLVLSHPQRRQGQAWQPRDYAQIIIATITALSAIAVALIASRR